MRRSIQVTAVAFTLLLLGCPKNEPPKQETKQTKVEPKSADEKESKTDDDQPGAQASEKPSAALTATPGVKYDPNGYPGGFAAECDHKLNGVSHQPEDYPKGGSCEQKWAPSCEAVLKCTAGNAAFAP